MCSSDLPSIWQMSSLPFVMIMWRSWNWLSLLGGHHQHLFKHHVMAVRPPCREVWQWWLSVPPQKGQMIAKLSLTTQYGPEADICHWTCAHHGVPMVSVVYVCAPTAIVGAQCPDCVFKLVHCTEMTTFPTRRNLTSLYSPEMNMRCRDSLGDLYKMLWQIPTQRSSEQTLVQIFPCCSLVMVGILLQS